MSDQSAVGKRGCYLEAAVLAILWIIFMWLFFPWKAIPYVFEKVLFWKGEWWEPFVIAWPVFTLGFVLNAYKLVTTVNPPQVHQNANQLPMMGLTTSLVAGIFEEVVFRWIMLYSEMGTFWVINELLKNTFGEPFLESIAMSPIVQGFTNWIISGNREVWLIGTAWTIALAVVLSNWKFQKGHLYQGLTGIIFSGIGGLFFFKIMFAHGLFAAMLVHFVFDLFVFTMLYIDVQIEKAMGFSQAHGKLYQWY